MSLKDHISTTAIQLFSRNGIRRVSMDDVARKAAVSKRTLYDFFRDKEDLLIEVIAKLGKPFVGYMELIEKQSDTALDVILLFNEKLMEQQTWLCHDFFEDINRYPKAIQLMQAGKTNFITKLVELLKRGKKEGVFMPDIDYNMISLMAQKQFSKSEPSELYVKYSPDEVHNTIFFIFLRGICTDAGRKLLDRYIVKTNVIKYESSVYSV